MVTSLNLSSICLGVRQISQISHIIRTNFPEYFFAREHYALCTVPCMPSKSDAEIPSARGISSRHRAEI